jgi:hypothetical protein
MENAIDVKTLSKTQIIRLVKDLIDEKLITSQLILQILDKKPVSESGEDLDYVEKLINKHFEEYDEVFRKLA